MKLPYSYLRSIYKDEDNDFPINIVRTICLTTPSTSHKLSSYFKKLLIAMVLNMLKTCCFDHHHIQNIIFKDKVLQYRNSIALFSFILLSKINNGLWCNKRIFRKK